MSANASCPLPKTLNNIIIYYLLNVYCMSKTLYHFIYINISIMALIDGC